MSPFEEETNDSLVFPMLLPKNITCLTNHLNLSFEKPYDENEEIMAMNKQYKQSNNIKDEQSKQNNNNSRNENNQADIYSRDPDKKIKKYYTSENERKSIKFNDDINFYEKDINEFKIESEHEIKKKSKGFYHGKSKYKQN